MGFLDINRATKSYGSVKVLHETNISAEEGEFLVIRLYNSSSVPVEKSLLEFGMDIQEGYLTDFSEVITQSLEQTGKRSFVLPEVKAYSAVTLKFKV